MGCSQVSRGLALIYSNTSTLYLGSRANLRLPGTGPGTLAPGWHVGINSFLRGAKGKYLGRPLSPHFY